MVPEPQRNLLLATATIVGTTVGAGIFGIPYVIAKAGIIPGIFYFLLLGGAVLLLHLFFGEVVLRTEGNHRLPGYAKIYIGNRGEAVISFSTLIGLSGTLLAYLVLGGEFLRTLFLPFFDISSFLWTIFLWAGASFFILRDIRIIARLEFWLVVLFLVVIFVIFFFSFPHFTIENFSFLNSKYIFLPYGVLLFSFAGWLAIPEAASVLHQGQKKYLGFVIVASALIVAVLYFLFAVAVVGVSGEKTTQDALSGLAPELGGFINWFGAFFGILAVVSSLLVLGNYLENALHYDYRIPSFLAGPMAVGIPLFLFLVGLREFILTIGFVGALLGAAEGVVISLIYMKSKKTGTRIPEYSFSGPALIPFLLIVVFLLGAAAEAYLIAFRVILW